MPEKLRSRGGDRHVIKELPTEGWTGWETGKKTWVQTLPLPLQSYDFQVFTFGSGYGWDDGSNAASPAVSFQVIYGVMNRDFLCQAGRRCLTHKSLYWQSRTDQSAQSKGRYSLFCLVIGPTVPKRKLSPFSLILFSILWLPCLSSISKQLNSVETLS